MTKPPMFSSLFAGPYYGEFGHELTFAAMVRAAAKRRAGDADVKRWLQVTIPPGGWTEITVCSRPAREALYADFAINFVPHTIQCEGRCAEAVPGTQPSAYVIQSYVPRDAQRLMPREYSGKAPTVFVRYGKPRKQFQDYVVLHARHREHVPERNWSQRNWHRFARKLLRQGLVKRLACVGTRRDALAMEGGLDLRDRPLTEQMDMLRSARLIIGPSSGPMHLAALCGCPQVVWCGGGAVERRNTMGRYRKTWNPFHTACDVYAVGSWQPPFERVWGWTTKALSTLERNDGR